MSRLAESLRTITSRVQSERLIAKFALEASESVPAASLHQAAYFGREPKRRAEESSGPTARRSRRLQNASTNQVDFRRMKETSADSRNGSKRQRVNGLRPQLAHRQLVEKLPKNRQFRVRLPPPPPSLTRCARSGVGAVASQVGFGLRPRQTGSTPAASIRTPQRLQP